MRFRGGISAWRSGRAWRVRSCEYNSHDPWTMRLSRRAGTALLLAMDWTCATVATWLAVPGAGRLAGAGRRARRVGRCRWCAPSLRAAARGAGDRGVPPDPAGLSGGDGRAVGAVRAGGPQRQIGARRARWRCPSPRWARCWPARRSAPCWPGTRGWPPGRRCWSEALSSARRWPRSCGENARRCALSHRWTSPGPDRARCRPASGSVPPTPQDPADPLNVGTLTAARRTQRRRAGRDRFAGDRMRGRGADARPAPGSRGAEQPGLEAGRPGCGHPGRTVPERDRAGAAVGPA